MTLRHRPERWQNLPEKVHGMPGVYSNILSFLAGPHACIGFRFSLAEYASCPALERPIAYCACRAKAILFTIAREFEFELAVPADDMERRSFIVGRPHIQGTPGGPQLPLLIRPVRSD